MKKMFVSMGLLIMIVLAHPRLANAEGARVVVSANDAPVFLLPDSQRTPLRLAKTGSVVNVIGEEGEWYQIEFQDPQFGRRVGYIERRHVRVQMATPAQQAVDLTIAESKPTPTRFDVEQRQISQAPVSRGNSIFPAAETAVSWSLLRHSQDGVSLTSSLGWNVSAVGNVTPWLGVVGDVGGNYKNLDSLTGGIVEGVNIHTFLSGPRFSGRFSREHVVPFGQFLGGLALANGTVFGVSDTSSYFTIQPGGGVDIALSDSVAVRFQVDYRKVFGDIGGANQFRFAPGIVIRSGSKAS